MQDAQIREGRNVSNAPTRPNRLQIDPAGRRRMEAVPSVPAVGSTGRACWRAHSSGTLRDQGQGALRREAHAAQTPRGPYLHGHVRCLLYRPWRSVRRNKVKAYPPGCVIVLPGDTSHFHWAKSGEYITQVTAIGPLGLDYLNPDDDPRQKNR